MDEKHATWLHLRVRSPHQPLADVGKLHSPKTSLKNKQLADGRWTLAFADADSCLHACLSIQNHVANQRHAVSLIVSPFLDLNSETHQ